MPAATVCCHLPFLSWCVDHQGVLHGSMTAWPPRSPQKANSITQEENQKCEPVGFMGTSHVPWKKPMCRFIICLLIFDMPSVKRKIYK